MKTKGFKRWMARPPRLIMVEALKDLLQGRRLGLPDMGGFLGEATEACHQTPARSTKPSNLAERLRYKCRGAAWSLLSKPELIPGQRPPSPWLLYLPPRP